MSCEQLVSELRDVQTYEIEVDSKMYQVEVELLENTDDNIHVMVAPDDARLSGIPFTVDSHVHSPKGRLSPVGMDATNEVCWA